MCLSEGIRPLEFWDSTFFELNEYLKFRRIERELRWEQSRAIIAALTGTDPTQIIRLPSIDGEIQKVEWTPELAEKVLKHFGEWPT